MATHVGKVVQGSLALRSGAGSSYTNLGNIPSGTQLNLTFHNYDWCSTTYNGNNGYVMSRWIQFTSGQGISSASITSANGGAVNIRPDPSTNQSPLFSLSVGTNVVVVQASVSTWKQVSCTLGTGYVMAQYLTTGSGGGTNPSFVAGNIGALSKTGVNIRSDSYLSAATMGTFQLGSKFIIAGTKTGDTVDGSNVWVSVRFGQTSGSPVTKYVHSSCIEDKGYGTGYTAKALFLEIAKSQVGLTGNLLGLGGQWCQNWMYWLAAATGRTMSLPFAKGYCPEALALMGTQYLMGSTPQEGDWVYYMLGSQATVGHVGLVTSVNTTLQTFTTVEGNLSGGSAASSGGGTTVGTATVNYLTGVGATARTADCFVRPSYM